MCAQSAALVFCANLEKKHPQHQEEACQPALPCFVQRCHAYTFLQNATQKVDSIIAENPDATLDELLASKKINADQKNQAQKKPALQAQLSQLEEQIAQYLQVDEEYQKRAREEKTALQSAHQDEISKLKEQATQDAAAEASKRAKDNLLTLSKFLRAAAAKRQNGDENSAENRAFEGALLLVYGGDANAVAAIENLISGSGEKVSTVDGLPSDYTCMQ